MAEVLSCSACGDAAVWFVTIPYSTEEKAGRALAYCSDCRRSRLALVDVAIPIPVLMADQDLVLGLLYELGFVATDPEALVEVLGLTRGAWTRVGEAAIEASQDDGAAGT